MYKLLTEINNNIYFLNVPVYLRVRSRYLNIAICCLINFTILSGIDNEGNGKVLL